MSDIDNVFGILREIKRGAASRKLSFWGLKGLVGGVEEADALIALHLRPDGLRIGELSHLLGSVSANTTRTTHALEKKGLAERTISSVDGRGRILRLNKEGHCRAMLLEERRRRLHDAMLADFSPKEREMLLSSLRKLLAGHERIAAELEGETSDMNPSRRNLLQLNRPRRSKQSKQSTTTG